MQINGKSINVNAGIRINNPYFLGSGKNKMLDYQTTIIQGFRVPYGKLFKEVVITKNRCKCDFDRGKLNYCPECGEENKKHEEKEYKKLIGVDFEKLGENDYEIGNSLVFSEVKSNCDLEGEDRDYIIGVKCLDEDSNAPDKSINHIHQIPEKEIKEKIEKLDIKIPFNKDSFGFYVILPN